MTSGNCPCTEGQHAITVGNHDIGVSSEERNLYSTNEIPEYINSTICFVVPCNLQQQPRLLLHLSMARIQCQKSYAKFDERSTFLGGRSTFLGGRFTFVGSRSILLGGRSTFLGGRFPR